MLDCGKDCLEEFAKELKSIKVVVILSSGSHGDLLTRLFTSHKSFYKGQLTGQYFKCCNTMQSLKKKLMSQCQENFRTEGRKDGRMDRL